MVTEIHSWTDLDAIPDGSSTDYILKADLTSSDSDYGSIASSTANGGSGWDPIDNFSGVFDGNGHIIEGLYSSHPGSETGLFGVNTSSGSATIKNLGVENAEIYAGDLYDGSNPHAGIIAARYHGALIERCYTTGYAEGGYVGGVASSISDTGQINDCYSLAEIDDSRGGAGIVQYAGSKDDVDRCYASATFSGGSTEPICYNQGTPSNCYADTGSSSTNTTSELQGDEASSNMTALDFSSVWETVDKANDSDTDSDSYPTLRDVSRKQQLQYRGIYVASARNPASTSTDTELVSSNTARERTVAATTSGTSAMASTTGRFRRPVAVPRDTAVVDSTPNRGRGVAGDQTDTMTTYSEVTVGFFPASAAVDLSTAAASLKVDRSVLASPVGHGVVGSKASRLRSPASAAVDLSTAAASLKVDRSVLASPVGHGVVGSKASRLRSPASAAVDLSTAASRLDFVNILRSALTDTAVISTDPSRGRALNSEVYGDGTISASVERLRTLSIVTRDVSTAAADLGVARTVSSSVVSTDSIEGRTAVDAAETRLYTAVYENPGEGRLKDNEARTGGDKP